MPGTTRPCTTNSAPRLSDSSLILFHSSRPEGGLMGYLTATGELVRLTTPSGALGGPTAARDRPSVFAMRGQEVVELALEIHTGKPSRVVARERVIARHHSRRFARVD